MRALVAILMAALLLGGAALTSVAARDDSRTDAGPALERAGAVLIAGNVRERSSAGGAQALERAGSRLSDGALERAVAVRASSIERAAALPGALERAGARSRGLSPVGGDTSSAASALERASNRFTGAESERTSASIALQASERAGAQIRDTTFARSGGENIESVLERTGDRLQSNAAEEEEELQTVERSGSRLSVLRPTEGTTDAANATERAGASLNAIANGRSGTVVAVQAMEEHAVVAAENSDGSAAPLGLPASVQARLSGLTPESTERATTGGSQERATTEGDAGARAVTEAGARLNGLDPRIAGGPDVVAVLERANAMLVGTSQERAMASGATQALLEAGARLSDISPDADAS